MRIRQANHDTAAAAQKGFTLMEVLVTLVVLGIGLLGLAALQGQGLRLNHDAYVRTQATLIAADIMERMRHAGAAKAATYLHAGGDPSIACNNSETSIKNPKGCWYETIHGQLPSGDYEISANLSGTDLYDIEVRWTDRDSGTMKTQTWTIQLN